MVTCRSINSLPCTFHRPCLSDRRYTSASFGLATAPAVPVLSVGCTSYSYNYKSGLGTVVWLMLPVSTCIHRKHDDTKDESELAGVC